jgi:hypothetical protein
MEDLKKYADEISFRLLATRNHEDYEWLLEILKKVRDNNADKSKED